MANKNSAIKKNITQVVLIVFSVVLGLYLSERIEERNDRQESDNLLNLIKSEVTDNMQLMEEVTAYHKEIHENLDSLSKDEVFIAAFINDKSILTYQLLPRGTFMPRYPSNDAWDIAKAHPLIANIDYDKLLILSKIYKQQELTFEPMNELFEVYKSKDVNLEKDAKLNLEIISGSLHELVAREVQLMYFYNQAEDILDL